MRPSKFCSECGTPIKSKRPGRLPFRSFCPRCSPALRKARLLLLLIPVACAAGGFALGRYTAARQPFHFIGAQASQPPTNEPSPEADRSPAAAVQQAGASTQLERLCGARTRSGRPCRRKVKGAGYCWQHRK